MTMFSRKAPPVQVGDRFVKAGDPTGKAWATVRIWTTTDGLPHARIENSGQQHETRIISISALTDPHFYLPAPPASL
jgi:hypothetical protein